MTAYELLAVLKPQGIKAPPVIYRALDALMKEGAIHKIKELGAFVACDCTQGHHHALSVITVCQECHAVVELHDHGVMHQLESLRDQGIRLSPRAVIELPVTCDACAA
jgi:Fur family zinc uptake transcriptional regulator